MKDEALSSVAHSQQAGLTTKLDRLSVLLCEMGASKVLLDSLAPGKAYKGSDLELLVLMDTALPFVN